MTGSPLDLGPAYQSLVTRLETFIRKTAAPAALRVAVVTTSDASDPTAATLGELFEVVKPRLQFNGKSQSDNETAKNYKEFTVDAAHSPESVAVDIVNFEPHIVISMIGSLFTDPGGSASPSTGVAAAIEQALGPTRFRPNYLLNPINADQLDAVSALLVGFSQVFGDIYKRFLGINVAGADDTRLYVEYFDRLHNRFPRAIPHTENFYDPLYYVAYSMYIAGVEQHLSGVQIRSGMARLLLGKIFDVGPGPIGDVFTELRNRQNSIELRGTMGLPVFDSGSRKGRGALYCFFNPQSYHLQEQVYDEGTQTWLGTFGCFDGF
jgi:hypothetical protein